MKRWLVYLGALALILLSGIGPFSGTDVGKLLPVEVVSLSYEKGQTILRTDAGAAGCGTDAAAALQDLKASAPGVVFLETADYLIVEPGCEDRIRDLTQILRPACAVCFGKGDIDLEEAAEFLRTHSPGITIQKWESGLRDLQILTAEGERLKLAG